MVVSISTFNKYNNKNASNRWLCCEVFGSLFLRKKRKYFDIDLHIKRTKAGIDSIFVANNYIKLINEVKIYYLIKSI
jgi:hypothetical protein